MFVIVYFLLFTSLLLKEVGSLSLYYLDIKRERRDEGGEGGMWHVYSVATIIARARGTSIYDVRAEGGSRNTPNLRTNRTSFADIEGEEVQSLWTSHMEAPNSNRGIHFTPLSHRLTDRQSARAIDSRRRRNLSSLSLSVAFVDFQRCID